MRRIKTDLFQIGALCALLVFLFGCWGTAKYAKQDQGNVVVNANMKSQLDGSQHDLQNAQGKLAKAIAKLDEATKAILGLQPKSALPMIAATQELIRSSMQDVNDAIASGKIVLTTLDKTDFPKQIEALQAEIAKLKAAGYQKGYWWGFALIVVGGIMFGVATWVKLPIPIPSVLMWKIPAVLGGVGVTVLVFTHFLQSYQKQIDLAIAIMFGVSVLAVVVLGIYTYVRALKHGNTKPA